MHRSLYLLSASVSALLISVPNLPIQKVLASNIIANATNQSLSNRTLAQSSGRILPKEFYGTWKGEYNSSVIGGNYTLLQTFHQCQVGQRCGEYVASNMSTKCSGYLTYTRQDRVGYVMALHSSGGRCGDKFVQTFTSNSPNVLIITVRDGTKYTINKVIDQSPSASPTRSPGKVSAVPSKCSLSSDITSVAKFTGRTSSDTIRVRNCPTVNASIIARLAPNKLYEFDAWTVGEPVKDEWTGKSDNRWFKIKGKDGWVASAVICGSPNADVNKLPCSGNNAGGNRNRNNRPSSNSSRTSTRFSEPDVESLAEYRQDNPFWTSGNAPRSVAPPNPRLGNHLGNCTWYANGRARQLGGNSANLDKLTRNAGKWSDIARRNGMSISKTPQVGAIAQWDPFSKGYLQFGHVAVVERVNSDGTILVSESSFGDGKWDFRYRTRVISANNPDNYIMP